jgi:allophanate hydrolase subunit 2
VSDARPRTHLLSVVYDGPDRAPVAARLGVSIEKLVELHHAPRYEARQLGFLPGFAYLGPVPELLHVPRLPQPRPRIAAHSVGLAAGFTGVYPLASPGGWNLLGRMVGPPLFDPRARPPARIAVGDEVRFEPITEAAARELAAPATPPTSLDTGADPVADGLVLTKVVGLATVQDGLRRAFADDGVPEGGPLDHEALAAANVVVGNRRDAAAIELARGTLQLQALGRPTWISVNGAEAIRIGIDEVVVVSAADAPRVVAVAGGVEVETLLGSGGTCLPGAFGGHEGRALRSGDRLGVGEAQRRPARAREVKTLDQVVLPVRATPMDDGGEAFRALLARSFRLGARSNRVGQRLDGPALPRRAGAELAPRPMVRGAIQVTHDGTPVVLGPDHPTTGGYPVVGHLDALAQAALGRLRVGGGIRFVEKKEA